MTIPLDGNHPLTVYAIKNLWAQPEKDLQYQVHIPRISPELGYAGNFRYLGSWRDLPTSKGFYQVYTVGGIDPGYWGFAEFFKTRNPLDRWVKVSSLSTTRGMQIDIYNGFGLQFPKNKAWVMMSYDGVTLIALEKTTQIPLQVGDEWYFRCYTPTVPVDRFGNTDMDKDNPYSHITMTYESSSELLTFMSHWNKLKAKSGVTYCYHNGIFTLMAPTALPLVVGDIVEIWHDPTVTSLESYLVDSLKDFYSERDQKRKVILHPPKVEGDFSLRYFDDNDYYITTPDGYGTYFHRNSETAVRQLTHKDCALAHDQIITQASKLPKYNEYSDKLRIIVFVRNVVNQFEIKHASNALHYLYRMNDADILNAMTGGLSSLPEWTANQLEQSDFINVVSSQGENLTYESIYNAIGYNGASQVLAKNMFEVTPALINSGFVVPPTYGRSSTSTNTRLATANEYDENGLLIESLIQFNSNWYFPKNSNCRLVEFIPGGVCLPDQDIGDLVGAEGLTFEYSDTRVYSGKFSNPSQYFLEKLVDVTDKQGTYYVITDNNDGTLTVRNGPNLPYGDKLYVTYSSRFAGKTFSLNHLDHTLSFRLFDLLTEQDRMRSYISMANYDVILNGHHLIDNVDWVYHPVLRRFFIFNREYLVPGAQQITVIGYGTTKDIDNPKYETELGFVENGKIGNTEIHNPRDYRNVKCVIGGKVFPIEKVANTETDKGTLLPASLEGKPYMVKHIYQDVRWGPHPANSRYGYDAARELDERVSQYLTSTLNKDEPLGKGTQLDRYALFSTFLNKVVNDIKLGVLTLPEKSGTTFTNQSIQQTLSTYEYLLAVDPVILNFDLRFFDIFPYANLDTIAVTPDQLLFIELVNKLYLKGVCKIRGHFEVTP